MAPQQQQQQPTRLSGRTPKPSERKRAHSASAPVILQPPKKKAKRKAKVAKKRQKTILVRSPLPSPSPPSPATPVEPTSADESEDENIEEPVEVEDGDVGLPSPPPLARFISVWKAVTGGGRESLPGTRSAVFDTKSICYFKLDEWKHKTILRSLPRKFKITQLQAVASYEKARQAEYCPQDIRSPSDLEQVLTIIKEWHKRWPSKYLSLNFTLYLVEEKEPETQAPAVTPSQQVVDRPAGTRTAAQVPITNLPDVIAAKEASGNMMPALADRWPCTNIHCRNKGKTCWQNKPSPDSPDIAINHYPVDAVDFQRWNKELLSGASTVEQPSQNIMMILASSRERSKKSQKSQKEPVVEKEDPTLDYIKQLVKLSVANLAHSMAQNPHLHHQYPTPSLNIEAPQNSSPIRSETDPVELLGRFFNWLANEPEFNSERQRATLEPIKDKLVEEEWDIDSLKSMKPGEGMTLDQWERYDFKIGTLVRIRSLISKFKRLG